MRIFVTGATGVIGKRVVPQLIGAGHHATAVARTAEKRASLTRQGADAVGADLFDSAALRRAVAGHDAVINLATSIPPSARVFLPGAWRENDRIRRVASHNLVEAALAGGVQRFVQESFAPTYPDSGDRWIDESVPLQPAAYNRSVLDAEAAAQRFTDAGRRGIVLRFAAFYGPDAWHLTEFIEAVRKGWAPLPGSPDGFSSSISHDDAASAVVAVLDAKAGVYNVGDDEPVTRRVYVDALADALGVSHPKLPPAWVVPLLGSVARTLARSLRISNRKLREECGWAPRYASIRQGWPEIVEVIR